jgi:hypothetical protein
MLAIVLRLLRGQLAAGEVTGWLEVVGTGQRQPLRNADDLVAALTGLDEQFGDQAAPSTR